MEQEAGDVVGERRVDAEELRVEPRGVPGEEREEPAEAGAAFDAPAPAQTDGGSVADEASARSHRALCRGGAAEAHRGGGGELIPMCARRSPRSLTDASIRAST